MTKSQKEALLIMGIGAISTGIERMSVSVTVGAALVVTGIALIGLRGYLK